MNSLSESARLIVILFVFIMFAIVALWNCSGNDNADPVVVPTVVATTEPVATPSPTPVSTPTPTLEERCEALGGVWLTEEDGSKAESYYVPGNPDSGCLFSG